MATANVVQTSISGGHSNALAIQGDGAFLPKLDTASRLALTLGTPDKGLMVYDTTLTTICVWSGTAWTYVMTSSSIGTAIYTGVIDPEGVVTAQPGSIYFNIAIAASPVQFIKGSGSGNTGWV
jgi:hypothetical protein